MARPKKLTAASDHVWFHACKAYREQAACGRISPNTTMRAVDTFVKKKTFKNFWLLRNTPSYVSKLLPIFPNIIRYFQAEIGARNPTSPLAMSAVRIDKAWRRVIFVAPVSRIPVTKEVGSTEFTATLPRSKVHLNLVWSESRCLCLAGDGTNVREGRLTPCNSSTPYLSSACDVARLDNPRYEYLTTDSCLQSKFQTHQAGNTQHHSLSTSRQVMPARDSSWFPCSLIGAILSAHLAMNTW